ncbi:hypothetical protein [Shewanella sp.]|jgi:hypothetical protein|uniref:hypothetical protein n=1 Tax=Shewanella sp. TaxID=50422 RepID=UPI003569BCE7|nr:hypothetical protein [Sulfuricurvum sp.]
MAATLQIHEMSALTTGTDKTSGTVRFKDADNATVDTNNPLSVPAAGSIYSYTKQLRVKMTDPPDTSVSNLRWYTDGGNTFGTGIGVVVFNRGTDWIANYKTQMATSADLFGYVSAATAFDGDVTDTGPFLPADDDSYIGDLIQLQMSVASTAPHRTLTAETLTLAYDEI